MPLLLTAAVLAAIWLAPAARAHHLMDGMAAEPGALDGLLSGLAHPLLGFDHLIFLVCAGLAGWHRSRRWVPLLLFSGLLGCLAGLRLPGLPVAELLLALSLVLLALVLRCAWPSVLLLPAMALHGYVLSSSVLGWESTPVLAYLGGLLISQSLLLLTSITLLRRFWTAQPARGWLHTALPLALVGLAFSLAALQLRP